LPIGGVVIRDSVADVLINRGGEFNHGFTYSGHPVSCAVAAANIRLMRESGVIEQVHDHTAPYFQQQWHALEAHPLIVEARGVGLIGGLALDKAKVTNSDYVKDGACGTLCRDLALEHGLVMRAVGDDLIICPPLIISTEEIDQLMSCVQAVLDDAIERLSS